MLVKSQSKNFSCAEGHSNLKPPPETETVNENLNVTVFPAGKSYCRALAVARELRRHLLDACSHPLQITLCLRS
jgi:hypothetical protein